MHAKAFRFTINAYEALQLLAYFYGKIPKKYK